MIILDTHVLVWLDEGSSRLGEKALSQIDRAMKKNSLYVSAISFWEVAMLVRKGRLEMHVDTGVWRTSLLEHGLLEIPLTGRTSITAANLQGFHGDPADRLIAATAIDSALRICTADRNILSWAKKPLCIDARR